MDGDRCRYCGTMDDRIHGLDCPVMQAHDCLLLALWAEHLEELLAESIASGLHGAGPVYDHATHVARHRDRIRKWRLDFHFSDPISKKL
jgi:hypothetical protein